MSGLNPVITEVDISTSQSIINRLIKYLTLSVVLFGLLGASIMAHNLYINTPTQIVIKTDNLTKAQYMQLLSVTRAHQPNGFFDANLAEIHSAVSDVSWVSQASIEREWKQGIIVTVQPRVAVAKFGSERLIDAQGQVFIPANDYELDQHDLVTLQGDASKAKLIMQHMQKVNEWFASSNIKVQDMILTPRMTWLIRFDNGLRVIVDNENTTQKLIHLSQLMTNQLRPGLSDIVGVDLRYKNGFAVTWKPPPVDDNVDTD